MARLQVLGECEEPLRLRRGLEPCGPGLAQGAPVQAQRGGLGNGCRQRAKQRASVALGPGGAAPAGVTTLLGVLADELALTDAQKPKVLEVLKQLGLPPGRVENLYRTPTEPIDPKHPEVVCDECQGIGYIGRTGIFELLVVDDGLRQVLATAPKLENLRAAARKARHRTLQEEGVLLVARGVTSLQELLRALKQ